jgi:hypothetical protein
MPSPGKPVAIDCPVAFSEKANLFGEFANAVRVTPEGPHECFLDFCVYSPTENQAQIVTRVRIHRSFLAVLLGRLEDEVQLDLEHTDVQDGKIMFLKSPKDLN